MGVLQAISRQLILKNFQCALDYIAAVGAVAEEAGHHPDLHLTSYRTVAVKLSTHARGGITSAALTHPFQRLAVTFSRGAGWCGRRENDLIVAAKTELVPATLSPKFVRENAEARLKLNTA